MRSLLIDSDRHSAQILMKRFFLCPCAVLLGALLILAEPAHALITETTIMSVGLSEVRSTIESLLESARQKGDYLLIRAVIEAKNAIDAWEAANSRLLGDAFKKLDDTAKKNFQRIEGLVDDINRKGAARLDQIQELESSAAQIVSMITPDGDRPYILKQRPRVIYRQKEPIRITLGGANLDTAEAELLLPNSSEVIRPSGDGEKTRLVFDVPVDRFIFDKESSSLNKIKLSYRNPRIGFIGRVVETFSSAPRVTREIAILALPLKVADLELVTTMKVKRKILNRQIDCPGHQQYSDGKCPGRMWAESEFRGYDTDQERAIRPEAGWKFDLEKKNAFSFEQYGEGRGNSYCIGWKPNEISENGHVFRAHVGRERAIPRDRDGVVNCKVLVYEYKEEEGTMPGLKGQSILTWADPTVFPLPQNLESFTLTGKVFDGRGFIHTQTGASDKFFKVKVDNNLFMVIPQVPEDIF
ncbi:exported hypothetical protein [Candidatus Nitrospira nitrificans]|uniref:Uncharacterized protein n=1 Tax=Candidatus Nitrospira nitrificans TaxID=1742973 RepID=A0A0S4LM81_9BACT|nr:exported hypothetical protein [Candidatus Nitrospira nitrificans]